MSSSLRHWRDFCGLVGGEEFQVLRFGFWVLSDTGRIPSSPRVSTADAKPKTQNPKLEIPESLKFLKAVASTYRARAAYTSA